MDGDRITVRPSLRARRLSMTVRPDGTAIVAVPRWAGPEQIDRFIRESLAWLERQRLKLRRLEGHVFLPRGRKSFEAHKAAALAFIAGRVEAVCARYGFRPARVAVKDMRRNWGSCSSKGNLNFNYKIAFLPQRLAEYVVTHEVCHLGRFDHSPAFWALVAETMPDHRALRRKLRKYHA
jgi:predicted metal-dependent hydrolase